jgi:hypothetical protein
MIKTVIINKIKAWHRKNKVLKSTNKVKTVRVNSNVPTAFKLNSFFSVKKDFIFFSLGQHLGHHSHILNSNMQNYLLCIYNNICILSLKVLLFYFLQYKNIFKSNFKNILIVSYDAHAISILNTISSYNLFYILGI